MDHVAQREGASERGGRGGGGSSLGSLSASACRACSPLTVTSAVQLRQWEDFKNQKIGKKVFSFGQAKRSRSLNLRRCTKDSKNYNHKKSAAVVVFLKMIKKIFFNTCIYIYMGKGVVATGL